MRKRRIEKAADDYAAKIPPTLENDGFSRHALADAFESGVQWWVNAFWHDRNIPAAPSRKIIMLVDKKSIFLVRNTMHDWRTMCDYYSIIKWAYMDDLIPDSDEYDYMEDGIPKIPLPCEEAKTND